MGIFFFNIFFVFLNIMPLGSFFRNAEAIVSQNGGLPLPLLNDLSPLDIRGVGEILSLKEAEVTKMLEVLWPTFSMQNKLEELANNGLLPDVALRNFMEQSMLQRLLELPNESLEQIVEIISKLMGMVAESKHGLSRLAKLPTTEMLPIIEGLKTQFMSNLKVIPEALGKKGVLLNKSLFEIVYVFENLFDLKRIIAEIGIDKLPFNLSDRDLLKIMSVAEISDMNPGNKITDKVETLAEAGGFLQKRGTETNENSQDAANITGQFFDAKNSSALLASTTMKIGNMITLLAESLNDGITTSLGLVANAEQVSFQIANMVMSDLILAGVLDVTAGATRLVYGFAEEIEKAIANKLEVSLGLFGLDDSVLGSKLSNTSKMLNQKFQDIISLYSNYQELLPSESMSIENFLP